MTQYYDDTAKDYAERAEAAAEIASQSKQQASTAATTATTQANIATNAAGNAATLVKSELENDVRAMKDSALSAASQASGSASAASGSAVTASQAAIEAREWARQAMNYVPLVLQAPPTTATEATLGRLALWHDDVNNVDHAYHLVRITGGSNPTYEWEECVLESMLGVPNGVASLGANGKVPVSQLPAGHGGGGVEPVILNAPPTTSTEGAEGQIGLWRDETNSASHVYVLVYTSTSASATFYHWEECVLVSMGNVAGGYPVLDENGKVASAQLPIGGVGSLGVVRVTSGGLYGILASNGTLQLQRAENSDINGRTQLYKPIVPATLDYAVRSVLPNVTVIPVATSDYSLVDSSATTNDHSHMYVHAPASAPTYRLPAVTDTTVSHVIELTVDFTNVQTYSFLDNTGSAVVPLSTPSITAGDVYTFKMEYSSIKSAWLVYPQKQGAVSDDYVMRSEVGAANGVAGLDANALVSPEQLPIATSGNLGGVKPNQAYGIYAHNNGTLQLTSANDTQLANRSTAAYAITVGLLNKAVTASLTDENHITLNAAQQATAQTVFNVPDVGATGASLGLSIDPQTYVMTLTLKNSAGDTLDTKTVDLPLETMVVSASYANGILTLTLQSGATTDIDISALVDGLIPTSEKGAVNGVATLGNDGKVPSGQLPTIPTALSQLTQDSTHRTVTDAEKTAWNAKSDFSGDYDDLTNKPDIPDSAEDVGAIPVSEKGAANGVAELDANGAVPSEQLPLADINLLGAVKAPRYYNPAASTGIFTTNGLLGIARANNSDIDDKTNQYRPIVSFNLNYAVRSVCKNITEIPAATSDYSLVDSSATTNEHSHTYIHAPTSSPTYRLPAVTNTAIAHYIELTVDFTNVQTYSFLDASGNEIVPLFTPSIAAGDVYTFKCEYSNIKTAWLIYPQKQGAVADDFVTRGEVGAANGVAGLNSNAFIDSNQLPVASDSSLGGVKLATSYGVGLNANNALAIQRASDSDINNRNSLYKPLVPYNLNAAVTAAITDANHITLDATQQATAQGVFNVPGLDSNGKVPTSQLPDFPTKTSDLTNDSGFQTASDVQTAIAGKADSSALTAHTGNTTIHVTAADKTAWNAKSDFSGSYNDLTNKPDIPDSADDIGAIPTTEKGVADGVATLDNSGKVPVDQLPTATTTTKGVVTLASSNSGLLLYQGELSLLSAGTQAIDERRTVNPIIPQTLDYAVRSVLPNVTSIPASTTDYSLLDSSATTNHHSHIYLHVPDAATVYRLPAVTNMGVKHVIELTVKFTNTTSYSILDSEGNAVPLAYPLTVAANDIVTFKMEYSAFLSRWVVCPELHGDMSFVPMDYVGEPSGVASLDANGKVPVAQLPEISGVVPAPLSGNIAPTIATAGERGQLYFNNDTEDMYVCAFVDDSGSTPLYYWNSVPAGLGGWLSSYLLVGPPNTYTKTAQTQQVIAVGSNINQSGTTNSIAVGSAITQTSSQDSFAAGYQISQTSGAYNLAAGRNNTQTGSTYCAVFGANNSQASYCLDSLVNGLYVSQASGEGILMSGVYLQNTVYKAGASYFGLFNTEVQNAIRITGGGTGANDRRNIEELSTSGDLYIAGGQQHGITVIPAATTSITLAEGVYSHSPSSPSTYTLPSVTYATRTHEIVISVLFSASALSCSFIDTSNNEITPLSTPEIEDGTVVSYLCSYEPLLSSWTVMPVVLGQVEAQP